MLDSTNGMKRGDYLIIQFGINDGSSACPRHVGSARYQELLGVMARAEGARCPPHLSNPGRRDQAFWQHGRGESRVHHRDELGRGANQVPVIDLHRLSYTLYNSLRFSPDNGDYNSGPVGAFFCNDHTHFEAAGARADRRCCRQGAA